ncbi:MAG: hemerythrin [Burkholderiales bacterium]|nr:hemerythrin [Burkholderiales bacterium]
MKIPSALSCSGVAPLGYDPMDEVHAEFDHMLHVAETAADEQLLPLLHEIASHCQAHFEMEDRWMRSTDFPKGDCHAREHAAVLASIAGVVRRVTAGEVHVGRTLVRSLREWFPAHAQHLDSALAHWMSSRRWGAKPVVFHRHAAGPAPSGSLFNH